MSFTLSDTTIYDEGSVFNTKKHAVNLYSPTNPENSIYGMLNGRLGNNVLMPKPEDTWAVRKTHVWPTLMARSFGTSSLLTVEYFSQSTPAGGTPYSNSYDPDRYGTVAGTSIKFFLPYSCVCHIDISTYLSIWRPFYVNDHDGGDMESSERRAVISAPARLRLVVDSLPVMERGLPFSAQLSPAHTIASLELADRDEELTGVIRTHEVTQGFYKSMHHVASLSAGWHEAHIEYYLGNATFGMDTTIKRGNQLVDTEVESGARLLCGIRNARVLSFKAPVLSFLGGNQGGQSGGINWQDYLDSWDREEISDTSSLSTYFQLRLRQRTLMVYVSDEKGEELVLKAKEDTGESDNLTVRVHREPE
tara:strand:- start:1248 stop:2336 length:1089 start_codon:yes stop_codon:yes gene_type:complete